MLDTERTIVPFRQIPRDLNCVTVLPAIPWTFNSIREPTLSRLVRDPFWPFPSLGSHQHQVRMSRIEVQRSNSRNKIIAITIAISSRTTGNLGGKGTRRGCRAGVERESGEGRKRRRTRLPQRAELQSTLMSCSHPRAPPAPFRCRRQFVVEASGITQMRLFSGRNVHSATKPAARARAHTLSCATHGIKKQGGRAKVKSAALSAAIASLRPRAADNIFFAESRRAVEWIFIGERRLSPSRTEFVFIGYALSHAEYRRSETDVVFKNSILRPRSSPSATRTYRDALTRVAKSTISPRGVLWQIVSPLN